MRKFGWKKIVLVVAIILFLFWLLGWFLSDEPDTFDVIERAQANAAEQQHDLAPGYTTTTALIEVLDTLLNKRGGYMANDILPPMALLDNIPAWEFGVLEMSRDLALAMRREFSRSQSQSMENPMLTAAQTALNIDHLSWFAPAAESEYEDAKRALQNYRNGLNDSNQLNARFYTRADNLRSWLVDVDKRLGSLSQRLSASVAQVDESLSVGMSGGATGQRARVPAELLERTSWWDVDDVFYEARGASWALLHYLKAVERDFADVLEKKNAKVSLQQIIRELEATQQMVWSPIILNGSGFGLVANHSLVMANYISRANAALIDLKDLLAQG